MDKKVIVFLSIMLTLFLTGGNLHIKEGTINQEDNYLSDMAVKEDHNGLALIVGTAKNDKSIQINLDYSSTDVILKNAYYLDLTEDGIDELCIELNIWNSVSPDMNTILIYDIENQNLLFPTDNKVFIYDGHIVDSTIQYKSFIKINGRSTEEEISTIRWNHNYFSTLGYDRKLLVEEKDYIIFYEKKGVSDNSNKFKILILDSNTLDMIQQIEVVLDKNININEKINDNELIMLSGGVLYIADYGELYWNSENKIFESGSSSE